MLLTKAQHALLEKLALGAEIAFRGEHYVLVNDSDEGFPSSNMWPSTFYGLFDYRMIERNKLGNYTLSEIGRVYLREEND